MAGRVRHCGGGKGVWIMGWLGFYRSRTLLDWPCKAVESDEAIEVDWRVRLGMLMAGLVITGLLVALAGWVGG